MLSMMYGEEFRFGFNVRPDSLGRALQAAQRAVHAGPSNNSAYLALAQALFFRKEFGAFRSAAERAIALNSMDGATIGYLALLVAFAGDWERGSALGERARQLNPLHPPWYWALPMLDAYHDGDYAAARNFALKMNMPGVMNMPGAWLTKATTTAPHGQLGDVEAGRKGVQELLTLMPDFAFRGRDELSKWYLPDLVESLMEGLVKAGLEIPAERLTSPCRSSKTWAAIQTPNTRAAGSRKRSSKPCRNLTGARAGAQHSLSIPGPHSGAAAGGVKLKRGKRCPICDKSPWHQQAKHERPQAEPGIHSGRITRHPETIHPVDATKSKSWRPGCWRALPLVCPHAIKSTVARHLRRSSRKWHKTGFSWTGPIPPRVAYLFSDSRNHPNSDTALQRFE